jgi:hypothetical protein
MKKALIPALFVICGTMASSLWRTVDLRCDVTQIEVASAVARPLLHCIARELFTRAIADSAMSSGAQVAEQLQGPEGSMASLLVQSVLNGVFGEAATRVHENNCPAVSISRWLVRCKVDRHFQPVKKISGTRELGLT